MTLADMSWNLPPRYWKVISILLYSIFRAAVSRFFGFRTFLAKKYPVRRTERISENGASKERAVQKKHPRKRKNTSKTNQRFRKQRAAAAISRFLTGSDFRCKEHNLPQSLIYFTCVVNIELFGFVISFCTGGHQNIFPAVFSGEACEAKPGFLGVSGFPPSISPPGIVWSFKF
jgi:hypothetical protein